MVEVMNLSGDSVARLSGQLKIRAYEVNEPLEIFFCLV